MPSPKPSAFVLAVSASTGRPVAFLVDHPLVMVADADPQMYARRYGLHVAYKGADGVWLNRYNEPYKGGTNLDALPYAEAWKP